MTARQEDFQLEPIRHPSEAPKHICAVWTSSLLYKGLVSIEHAQFASNLLNIVFGFIETAHTAQEAEKKKRADKEYWMKAYAILLGTSTATLTGGTLSTALSSFGLVHGSLAVGFAPLSSITFAVAIWTGFAKSVYQLHHAIKMLDPIESIKTHLQTCRDIQKKIQRIDEKINTLDATKETEKNDLKKLRLHFERGYARVKQQAIAEIKVEFHRKAKKKTEEVSVNLSETPTPANEADEISLKDKFAEYYKNIDLEKLSTHLSNMGIHSKLVEELQTAESNQPPESTSTPQEPDYTPHQKTLITLSNDLIEIQEEEKKIALTCDEQSHLDDACTNYDASKDTAPPEPSESEKRLIHYRDDKKQEKVKEKILNTVSMGCAAVGATLIATSVACPFLLPAALLFISAAIFLKSVQLFSKLSSNKKRNTVFEEIETLSTNDYTSNTLNEFLQANNHTCTPKQKNRLWLAYQLYCTENPLAEKTDESEKSFYTSLFDTYSNKPRALFLGMGKRQSKLDEYLEKTTHRMMEQIILRQLFNSDSYEKALDISDIASLMIPSDNLRKADATIQGLTDADREAITRTFCERFSEYNEYKQAHPPSFSFA